VSTAACNRCSGLISFILASNGRWRPVEASYTALELDEDEVTVLRVEGNWTAQVNTEVRVYQFHRCPEDPALRRGQARTVVVGPEVVDLETGVVEEARPVRRAVPPFTCPHCGAVDDHNADECPDEDPPREAWNSMARCLERHSAVSLTVQCPECWAEPEQPCLAVSGVLRMTQHVARNLRTAFQHDQPWPPESGQRGYAALRTWLQQNPTLLATPQEDR